MYSDLAVSVSNISKCYQTYAKPSHRLLQAINANNRKFYTEFWALRDASFEINKGETFGIIGQNGSGKSTLLQIIAGTLRPTAGSVDVIGRIAAILELGAGFNPEFDGIENARLNAAIIGVSEKEFKKSLPQIIEFSGLGDFIHKPVKTYSSGMYVRLAFSVSISLKPDVLIIDEALAVGDARFQRKCFRKLESLKAEGVTIIFVSHSMESVVNHCDRALYLESGQIQLIGEPKKVVNTYLDALFKSDAGDQAGTEPAGGVKSPESHANAGGGYRLNQDPSIDACRQHASYNVQEYRWGDQRAKIIDYVLLVNDDDYTFQCEKSDRLTLCFAVYFEQGFEKIIFGMTIKTTDGKTVYGTNNRLKNQPYSVDRPGEVMRIKFEFVANLAAGDYFISLGVAADDEEKDHVPLDRRYDLIHFKVADDRQSFGVAELGACIELL